MHKFRHKKHWMDYVMELIKVGKAFLFLRVLLGLVYHKFFNVVFDVGQLSFIPGLVIQQMP